MDKLWHWCNPLKRDLEPELELSLKREIGLSRGPTLRATAKYKWVVQVQVQVDGEI